MPPLGVPFETDALVQSARTTPGLELLLMFGSRARGEAQAESDWDFGYLATDGFDATALLSAIVESLGTDRVDVVDLRRASGLLRYRAARDGQVMYEAHPRLGERFRLEAAQFWCDAAPVLQRGDDEVLAELKR
jgi:predicted nucleotidyltransferase